MDLRAAGQINKELINRGLALLGPQVQHVWTGENLRLREKPRGWVFVVCSILSSGIWRDTALTCPHFQREVLGMV